VSKKLLVYLAGKPLKVYLVWFAVWSICWLSLLVELTVMTPVVRAIET